MAGGFNWPPPPPPASDECAATPPPLFQGSRGHTLACGKGVGEPIQAKKQPLWYSV